MSYVKKLIADVNKTHKNLGELVAILQISVKARKMVMIVAPSGTGKSVAMDIVTKGTPDSMSPDKLSIAGLAVMADRMTSFRSVIKADDITTTQTEYARKTLITTLAALCYTHRIETIMQGQVFAIEDFYGSALIGVQPIILKQLMKLEEWDGSIQDKALRYYHLHRPIEPAEPTEINIEYKNGFDIDRVPNFQPDIDNPNWPILMNLALSQWSIARSREHIKDMLRAIAALESRTEVIPDDYELLAKLLKPMAVENIVVNKRDLEGERFLDNTTLVLLVEYYTYGGEFPLMQVAQDFKTQVSQTYKIMAENSFMWEQCGKSPTLYRPSKHLKELLDIYELDIESRKNGAKNAL